jgi:hypothetical protein
MLVRFMCAQAALEASDPWRNMRANCMLLRFVQAPALPFAGRGQTTRLKRTAVRFEKIRLQL